MTPAKTPAVWDREAELPADSPLKSPLVAVVLAGYLSLPEQRGAALDFRQRGCTMYGGEEGGAKRQ